MPPKPATSPPPLVFLDPVDKPSAGPSAKTRKIVRSHLTFQQHRRRKQQESQAREDLRARQEDEVDTTRLSHRLKGGQGTFREGATPHTRRARKERAKQFDPLTPPLIPNSSADLFHPLAAPLNTGSLAVQLYILNDPTNTIGNILRDLHTDALSIIDHAQTNLLNNARTWEQQFQPLTKPGTAAKYVPAVIFHEPALLASGVLLGIALRHHSSLSLGKPDSLPRRTMGRSILRLRGHVMRAINEALDDVSRATTDHMIVAVVLLATSEALFGFRESCPVHMEGMMGIVNARGGLRKLGYEGCVEAFVLWQDQLISRMTGGKTYSHLAKNRTLMPSLGGDKGDLSSTDRKLAVKQRELG